MGKEEGRRVGDKEQGVGVEGVVACGLGVSGSFIAIVPLG